MTTIGTLKIDGTDRTIWKDEKGHFYYETIKIDNYITLSIHIREM